MGSFSATIADWADKTEAELTVIMREATEDTVTAIDALVPVDTGFLRNTHAADLNGDGAFPTAKPIKGDTGDDTGEVALVIAGMEAGDIAHVAWTAVYAARVNWGFTGADSLGRNYEQGGAHFLERGAASWPDNVAEAVKRNAK